MSSKEGHGGQIRAGGCGQLCSIPQKGERGP